MLSETEEEYVMDLSLNSLWEPMIGKYNQWCIWYSSHLSSNKNNDLLESKHNANYCNELVTLFYYIYLLPP
jgi:hypothetical protein